MNVNLKKLNEYIDKLDDKEVLHDTLLDVERAKAGGGRALNIEYSDNDISRHDAIIALNALCLIGYNCSITIGDGYYSNNELRVTW